MSTSIIPFSLLIYLPITPPLYYSSFYSPYLYYPFSLVTSLLSLYNNSSSVPSIILPSIITLLLNPHNLSNPSRRPPLPFPKRGSHGLTALSLYELLDWRKRALGVGAVIMGDSPFLLFPLCPEAACMLVRQAC